MEGEGKWGRTREGRQSRLPHCRETVKLRRPSSSQLRLRMLVEHDALVRRLGLRRLGQEQRGDIDAVQDHVRHRRSGQCEHRRKYVVHRHLPPVKHSTGAAVSGRWTRVRQVAPLAVSATYQRIWGIRASPDLARPPGDTRLSVPTLPDAGLVAAQRQVAIRALWRSIIRGEEHLCAPERIFGQ